MGGRRWRLRAALIGLAGLGVGFDCSGAPSASGAGAMDTTWSHPQGSVSVDVGANPFALVVRDAQGRVLLESTPPHDEADPSDPLIAYAPLSFTHNEDQTVQSPGKGWNYYRGQDGPWQRATTATAIAPDGDALVVSLATTDAAHPSLTLRIEPSGAGVRLRATVDDPGSDPDSAINRVSFG
jgi:hypothetical protein